MILRLATKSEIPKAYPNFLFLAMRGTPSFPPVGCANVWLGVASKGPDVAPRGPTPRPGDAGGSVVASGASAAAHRAAWLGAQQIVERRGRRAIIVTATGQVATIVLPEN